MDWYNTLNKPIFTPAQEVFLPAWSILYTLIAISLVLFLMTGFTKEKITPIVLFTVQMILNFIWGSVFFGAQNIALALISVIFMWLFILLTILAFYKYSKIAAILLIPYFLWVSFACYLNFGFYLLNK